jgi:endonuclease-3
VGRTVGVDATDEQAFGIDADMLALPGAPKCESEGDVEHEHPQPEKSGDGPSADDRKGRADDAAHTGHTEQQDDKPGAAHRLVRIKGGLEGPRFCRHSGPLLAACRLDWFKYMPTRALTPRSAEVAPKGSLLSADEVVRFFALLAEVNPAPRTELVYADPFTLLVAVVLSAQATDIGVNRATKALFAAAPTPQAMLALGEEALREHIKTIGLFRAKAKNVLALSRALLERHGGKVPRERAALEALPGVGRKTANVVLNEVFGESTIAVDTHVFRVANRTGLAPGRTPEAVEATLNVVVPPRFKRGAHHWLILHGRYVCIARRPACPACVVRDICRFADKTLPGAAPAKPRSQAARA